MNDFIFWRKKGQIMAAFFGQAQWRTGALIRQPTFARNGKTSSGSGPLRRGRPIQHFPPPRRRAVALIPQYRPLLPDRDDDPGPERDLIGSKSVRTVLAAAGPSGPIFPGIDCHEPRRHGREKNRGERQQPHHSGCRFPFIRFTCRADFAEIRQRPRRPLRNRLRR